MRKIPFYLYIILLFGACSSPSPEKIDQDKTLFELGNKMYDKGRYADAAPYFESLKNRFPDSPYDIESELKLAESHFKSREYESAQVDYEAFRSLHPTHEKIPYVYLQLGKCQLYEAPVSVQKDQTETEQAVQTFNQLNTRWPTSTEANESKKFMDIAQEKLARKQLYLANYYIGQKKYFPALRRLELLNKDETPQPVRREALYQLGYVHMKMKNFDVAKMAFEKVVSENIDDKYQKKSKNYLNKIQKEPSN